MEKSRFSRLTGVIYVVGALFGLLISIGGLAVLWSTKSAVTRTVTDTVELASRTLDATRITIQVVSDSLEQASTNLDLIHEIIGDVASSLQDSNGLLTTTAGLVGNDMVSFVEETQASLATVQTSARLVDDTLRFISGIPFIGGRYRPEVPLQDSVAEVSNSLEPLPESFNKIRRELDVSAANLDVVQREVELLGEQVQEIDTSLSEAIDVVDRYRLILVDLRDRLDVLERYLPAALNTIYLGSTAVLIWIFITQLGLLLHGIEMLG